MTEENPEGSAPPAEEAPSKVLIIGPATDVNALTPEEKGWVLRAAAKIDEAEKAAADAVEQKKLKDAQHEQSSEGRRERRAEAASK